jgi:hypothetical protein
MEKEKKQYSAQYVEEIVTKSGSIINNGFSCIEFENIGSVNARVGNAPLTANGFPRAYNNLPNVEINTQFILTFDKEGTDKKVLIKKTYYNEFK